MNEKEAFGQSIAGSNFIYKLHYMLLSQDISFRKNSSQSACYRPNIGRASNQRRGPGI
jgi:hypothetical protein